MRRARYIVVLGPDGSGKTSVADSLAKRLSERFFVRRKNFSFGYMPPLSRVLGRAVKDALAEGQCNAGMVRPVPWPKAVILGVWYGIDHVLGHVTLRLARPTEIIIFARSYHDFLYQRAYLNLPRGVARLFLALGPTPDVIATPLRDADEIHRCKPELTASEIREQYARIQRSLGQCRYFAAIDARLGVEHAVGQILERVGL